MTLIYRAPRDDEASALSNLGRETFCETFSGLYSADDLSTYLENTHSLHAIIAEMSNPRRHYYVAADAGRLLGYCKIGEGVTLDYDPQGRSVVELKQLYVRASHHGNGTAQALMQWATDKAVSLGADEMLLSVYNENLRAQSFYQKLGFVHIADTVFMVGDQADHEFLYLKKLK